MGYKTAQGGCYVLYHPNVLIVYATDQNPIGNIQHFYFDVRDRGCFPQRQL